PSLSRFRGAPAASPAARLFHMGVRFAEVEAAQLAADSGGVRSALHELGDAAAASAGAGADAVALAERPTPPSDAERTALAGTLRASEGREWMGWFDLGLWCE